MNAIDTLQKLQEQIATIANNLMEMRKELKVLQDEANVQAGLIFFEKCDVPEWRLEKFLESLPVSITERLSSECVNDVCANDWDVSGWLTPEQFTAANFAWSVVTGGE